MLHNTVIYFAIYIICFLCCAVTEDKTTNK